MKISKLNLSLVVILLFSLTPILVSAQPITPPTISYQGRVLLDGEPFHGTGFFKFAIVDSLGHSTWSNDGSSVDGSEPLTPVLLEVTSGLFSVRLGNPDLGMEPLESYAFVNPESWLRVWFGPDEGALTLLEPDRPVAAVPYALVAELSNEAFNADTVDGQHANAFAVTGHDHWGETWEGGNFGLRLSNSSAAISSTVSLADFGNGLVVDDASEDGIQAKRATDDGLQIGLKYPFSGEVDGPDDDGIEIWEAGNPPTHTMPVDVLLPQPYHDGIDIAGAEHYGLWIGYAGLEGVRVEESSSTGITVYDPDLDGLHIWKAGEDGIKIGAESLDPVSGDYYGPVDDGIDIWRAGDPGGQLRPSDVGYVDAHDGIDIAGAEDFGLWVGVAGRDGVHVEGAGRYALYGKTTAPGSYGVYSDGDAHVAGNLSWAPKTSYIAVGPRAFLHDNLISIGHYFYEIEYTGSCSPGDDAEYGSHLQLPHDARLIRMTFYYKDASADDDSYVQLIRTDLAGSFALIAQAYSDGDSATPSSSSVSIPAGMAVVDNSQHAYVLNLHLFCQNWLYGVVIEYEVAEPY